MEKPKGRSIRFVTPDGYTLYLLADGKWWDAPIDEDADMAFDSDAGGHPLDFDITPLEGRFIDPDHPQRLGWVTVEITYSDGSKRTVELSVERGILFSGDGRSYPGVIERADKPDNDAEIVAYGINEGRVTHCDYRPIWAEISLANDEPDAVELVAWRVTGGVETLRRHGIIDDPPV